jgi:hypothetical protein
MSTEKQFLFVNVGLEHDRQRAETIKAGLEQRGAKVNEIVLEDNYEQVLDQIESGAIPVVLKG